jgi:hypothetical protein
MEFPFEMACKKKGSKIRKQTIQSKLRIGFFSQFLLQIQVHMPTLYSHWGRKMQWLYYSTSTVHNSDPVLLAEWVSS